MPDKPTEVKTNELAGTLQAQLQANLPKKQSPFLTQDGAPRYWKLYYRYGNIPQLEKAFRHDGDTKSAIMRARKHCELLKLKYIVVRPLIVDLDYQEDQYLRNKNTDGFSPEEL